MNRHRSTRYRRLVAGGLGALGLLALGLGHLSVARAAAPAAGTVIGNQASATYTDASGTEREVTSNLEQTTVQQVGALTLTPDNNKYVAPGGQVTFPHILANTGNGPDTFRLAVVNATGDVFDYPAVAIYRDANLDGLADNTTPITTTGPLGPGETFGLVIVATVPAGATDGQTGRLTVTAVSAFDGTKSAANTDTGTINDQAVLNLTKASSLADATPGATNTYTLSYANTGNNTATNLVITDVIPTSLTYVPGSGRWSVSGATALTDTAGGDPAGINYTYTNSVHTLTATVATVAPSATAHLTFQVVVNAPLASGTVENKAEFTYDDGSGNKIGPQPSNTVELRIHAPAGVIVDDDPLQAGDPALDDTVTVTNATQGSVVIFQNRVHNTGAGPDIFNITLAGSSFPGGTTFQLYQADGSTPLVDTDGDGMPDTGVVAGNATATVVVKATLPPPASGNNSGAGFAVTKTGTSSADPVVHDTVTDKLTRIQPSTVDLTNNHPLPGAPGAGAGPEAAPVLTNVTNANAATRFVLVVNNTSPAADSYDLAASTDSAFGALSLPAGWTLVFHDANGAVIVNTGPVPAGGHVLVYADITIPAGATPGDTELYFRTLSPTTGAADRLHDRVTTTSVEPAVALTILKSASTNAASPNTVVGYSFTVAGTRAADALGITVVVDGSSNSLVIVRDPVPANTTFAAFGNLGGGTALYHRRGDPLQTYTTTAPADIDAAAIGFPTLPAGGVSCGFAVKLNANASGPIHNQAELDFRTAPDAAPTAQPSNEIVITVPLAVPTIRYYTDATFGRPATATGLGEPLFVQGDAAACNLDPLAVETHPITIRSTLTGDVETFPGTETGPNTGLFRISPPVPTADADTATVTPGDGVLQARRQDTLVAELQGCGSASVSAVILLDPVGVVFDSRTGQPVAGVTVTLLDVTGAGNGGQAGGQATVYQFDGVTPAPATVVTTADGSFRFPAVMPSTYRVTVTGPATYTFPSVVPVASLPGTHLIDEAGSYGNGFAVTVENGNVRFDVPIDPAAGGGTALFIEKVASASEAEIGDLITYTIRVKNNDAVPIVDVQLVDALPRGFSYQRRTATRNGAKLADPRGGEGPDLQFALGTIPAQSTVVLVYRVRVGVGALQGTGRNRAQASADGPPPVTSNIAEAKVQLRQGVFTDKGIILGKVFVDLNRDDLQQDGEPGIPGVRLYLEDGTYVVTDSEGKYSFYGLTALAHVLKVDETTLPAGFKGTRLTQRHNARGTLCLVDLHRQELRKVNFADVSGDPQVLAEVARRRANGDPDVAEVERTLKQELTTDGQPLPQSDVRALPATGVIGAGTSGTNAPARSLFTPALPPATLTADNSNIPERPVALSPRPDLGQALTNATAELDFLDYHDGDTLALPQTTIRVKGPLGSKFALAVNGKPVSPTRLGKKVRLAAQGVEAWEFVGIDLQAGRNTVLVNQSDSFGNLRGTKSIVLVAPGQPGKLRLGLPTPEPIADGVTPSHVRVTVTDDRGVAVSARTAVTLETTLGRWDVPDLNPDEPGVQTFVADGAGEFAILPPPSPGNALIVVSSGILRDEATLAFLPALRPLVAAGIIDTRIQFRSFDLSALRPVHGEDEFENELRQWAFSADNGQVTGGGRAALFLKGKIKGDYLLTMAYDSEKESDTRLFRDIQPDEFYPVYGDSSVRGYDAQSTSRLYVRVDKNKCYLLYGDLTTASDTEARGLGNYSRSLTGPKLHLENDRVKANAWAAYDSTRQVIHEFPADGTSGPFFFAIKGLLENSEQVELIVRDRNQRSVILTTTALARFADYELEPFAGRLLLRRPVPSLDERLNPISIRVTFEVDQGGDQFWVVGTDAQVKVLPGWEVGGATVYDADPLNHYQLYSVNTTLALTPTTHLLAEIAQSHTDLRGSGDAGRVEVRHTGPTMDWRVYAAHVETNFDNVASVVAAGREELGFKLTYRLTPQDRVVTEGLHTRDLETKGDLNGAQAYYEHTFDCQLTLGVGFRHSDETAEPATATGVGGTPLHVNSVQGRASTPLPFLPRASLEVQYENDIEHTDRRAVSAGGRYQLNDRTRAYARHEFLDALGSPFELNHAQENNRTVFGLETEYLPDAHLFNEYRMRDADSGREAEAAIGLRNDWHFFEGVRLQTSFERVNPVLGSNDSATATAATFGWEYLRAADWKTTGRLEYRHSDTSDHWLNTLGYARKLDEEWTGLARTILNVEDRHNGEDDLFEARLQLGLAYRPARTDKWNALGKYELKYEDDGEAAAAERHRVVNILSLQVNVQPVDKVWLSGRYALKLVHEDADTYDAHLVAGRVMYDLTKRWSVALNGSALFSSQDGSVQYGVGPEVGFRFADAAWVAVGYNLLGFNDRDLSAGNYTDHGVYLAMRLLFDEHLVDGLKRGGGQ